MNLAELEQDLPQLTGWPTKRVAEARSALKLLSRVVGRPLSEIPADPEPIRKLLDDAPWQVHDVKKARWANVRSLIVSTLHEDKWPELDRKLWKAAQAKASLLDERGIASSWRLATLRLVRNANSLWLRMAVVSR